MYKFWKSLELEWKLVLLAAGLLLAFAWPVQRIFVNRLQVTLRQSVDPGLEPLLRSQLDTLRPEANQRLVPSLERSRQWQAMIPIIVREQQAAVIAFSILLFLALILLALWTLKRLTRPLKDLAAAADQIGRAEHAAIRRDGSGSLGRLQQAMAQMQAELSRHREQAKVQGMEQAWRDIARVMAHEIKNPLTPLRLTLDQMQEKLAGGSLPDPDQVNRAFERINAQIESLERLVNAFRSFAREPEAQLRLLALRPVLEGAAADFQPGLRTDISGDAEINGDPHLLQQVFLNIWKNAAEAGATAISVRLRREGNGVWLAIADNGPGLDRDKLDKVWIPYVTYKPGGTGLGLPVVRRLVEAMHGTVSLASRQGTADHGVTVEIRFPDPVYKS